MKRIIVLLIVLAVGLCAAACFPNKKQLPSEGLEYALSNDGTGYAVIGIGACTDSHIIIPATYNGKPVTTIGRHAFFGCAALTGITIPNSITGIEGAAFERCTGLTALTIPDSVTRIGENTFAGCTGLTELTIPDSVTNIGEYAFSGCTGLAAVTLPNSITQINGYTFSGCTGLTELTIPRGVKRIAWNAFAGCTGLTKMTVDSGNGFYHSAGNCIIETGARKLVAGCKTSVIPTDGSVLSIGDYAFSGCTGLAAITLPHNIFHIYPSAFLGCTGLTAIALPRNVTHIYSSAFRGCTGLTRITYTGTTAQWNEIEKGSDWDLETGNYTVYCTDGSLSK